jgi:hypothetical protein
LGVLFLIILGVMVLEGLVLSFLKGARVNLSPEIVEAEMREQAAILAKKNY